MPQFWLQRLLSLFTTFGLVGREEEAVCNTKYEREVGSAQFPNGDKYYGQFLGPDIDGFGIVFGADGTKYFGDWVKNRLNGVGCELQVNRDIFCGIWVDGEIDGLGVHRTGDKKSSFVGHYVGDRVPGCGIWTIEVNGTMVIENLYGDERCAWWSPLCWYCGLFMEDTLREMMPLAVSIAAMEATMRAVEGELEEMVENQENEGEE